MQTTKEEEIKQTMQTVLSASSNIKSSRFWKGLPYKTKHVQWEGTFDEKLEQISGSEFIDIVQNMINSVDNDKVSTITGSLHIVSEKFELMNSNGLNFSNKATHISGIINAESEHGETSVSGIRHACSRTYSNFSPE